MENGKKPINPILDWNEVKADSIGLTKREYFAGLALQGLMAQATMNEEYNNISRAKFAVDIADELLRQLEK